MNMKMRMNPGEMLCDKCNGTGFVNSKDGPLQEEVCPKCRGQRKIDWVENVVGVTKPPSVLDQANVVRTITYIESCVAKEVSKHSIDKQKLKCNISAMLEGLRYGRGIYDYKVEIGKKEDIIHIFFQPTRAVEIVNIEFTIR